MNAIKKITLFLSDVKIELGKVTWPSKRRTIKDSVIVIVISLGTAAFLGGVDFLFSFLVKEFVSR